MANGRIVLDVQGVGQVVAQHLLDALGSLRAEQGEMSQEDIARHQHAPDWVRWGDSKSIGPLQAFAPAMPTTSVPTSQALRVDGSRPTTWYVLLVADFDAAWAADTATVDVVFETYVGLGSTMVKLVDTVTVAAPYAQVVVQRTVPSKDIQVRASLVVPAGSTTVGGENVTFSCLAAPVVV
jgi:hypothetical protein